MTPHHPLHRIAARVRIWLDVNGYGWAANGDWKRWALYKYLHN